LIPPDATQTSHQRCIRREMSEKAFVGKLLPDDATKISSA
jgi:hypothetical protein